MQRYPVNASPHASPSTCTCKPDASPSKHMQARCKPELAHAATCKSEIATQTHSNSHHMQLTYTANTYNSDTATLTCNSHLQLTHATQHGLQPAYIGLHRLFLGLACAAPMQGACSDIRLMQARMHRACIVLAFCCIVFASCLHGVACTCKSDASPINHLWNRRCSFASISSWCSLLPELLTL